MLRGIAIALVLIRHAWPEEIGGAGVVGVVAFFALSGYLITGLLLRDIGRNVRVSFVRFYRNRVLRLYPPLLFMVLGLVVVTLTWDPLHERGGLIRAVIISLTYTGDIPINQGSLTIGHLWTLATEEQFYIIWPVLVMVAITFRKVGWLLIGAAGILLVACAATMLVTYPTAWRVYPLPSSWAIAMVIGAAAQIYKNKLSFLSVASGRRASLIVIACVILGAISLLPEQKASPITYFVYGPLVALATVVIIFRMQEWTEIPSRWWRPLLGLGTISYAAYLWNYPIVTWIGARPLTWWQSLLSIVLTIVMALISWWLIERPISRWRQRHDARPTGAAREVGRGHEGVAANS